MVAEVGVQSPIKPKIFVQLQRGSSQTYRASLMDTILSWDRGLTLSFRIMGNGYAVLDYYQDTKAIAFTTSATEEARLLYLFVRAKTYSVAFSTDPGEVSAQDFFKF